MGYATKIQKSDKCAHLIQEDEVLSDVASLPSEQIILRWFNLTLRNAQHDIRVYSFTSDFKVQHPFSSLSFANLHIGWKGVYSLDEGIGTTSK